MRLQKRASSGEREEGGAQMSRKLPWDVIHYISMFYYIPLALLVVGGLVALVVFLLAEQW